MTDHAPAIVQRILNSEAFRAAATKLDAEHDRMVEDIIRLTEIESPPFREATRADVWRAMAEAHGLENVTIDDEGNVTGIRRGIGNGPAVSLQPEGKVHQHIHGRDHGHAQTP